VFFLQKINHLAPQRNPSVGGFPPASMFSLDLFLQIVNLLTSPAAHFYILAKTGAVFC